MTDSRQASYVNGVSCRSADGNSDSFMFQIKYRPKIEIMNTSACGSKIKFDVEKFKDGPIYKDLQRTIKDGTDKQTDHDQNNIGQKWTFTKQRYMQLQKKQLGLLNQKEETTGLMRIAIVLFKF